MIIIIDFFEDKTVHSWLPPVLYSILQNSAVGLSNQVIIAIAEPTAIK